MGFSAAARGAAIIVFLAVLVGGCLAVSVNREEDKSHSGCLEGTDVFVTLDAGMLDAAQAVTCTLEGSTNDLPDSVGHDCMKSQPGIGAGVMQVTWRDTKVLVSSTSCEPR